MADDEHGHEPAHHEHTAREPEARRSAPREKGRQLDRVNAFSDGVFTIAATLLVLSIDLPTGSVDQLSDKLPDLVEPTLTYFLSFAVIGRFWLRHHQLFGRLRFSDQRFATINLVFLSFVALLPAPTELLGRYPGRTAPVVIYAANLLIMSLLLRWLFHDSEARGLTDIELGAQERNSLGAWIMTGAFFVSIPLAFVIPRLTLLLWIVATFAPRIIRIINQARGSGGPARGG